MKSLEAEKSQRVERFGGRVETESVQEDGGGRERRRGRGGGRRGGSKQEDLPSQSMGGESAVVVGNGDCRRGEVNLWESTSRRSEVAANRARR